MACTKVSYESEFAQSPYLTFGQNLQFTLKCMSLGESLDDLACPAQSIALLEDSEPSCSANLVIK